MRTRSPAASERRVSSPASGSTPIIRIEGRNALATVAQPAMRPPPLTGTGSSRAPEVLEQLERNGPLAGHHERIVVRLYQLEPALVRQPRPDLLAALGPAV